jgi:hypothetical protein
MQGWADGTVVQQLRSASVRTQDDEREPLRASPVHANGAYSTDAGSADEEDPFVEVVAGTEGYPTGGDPSAVSRCMCGAASAPATWATAGHH